MREAVLVLILLIVDNKDACFGVYEEWGQKESRRREGLKDNIRHMPLIVPYTLPRPRARRALVWGVKDVRQCKMVTQREVDIFSCTFVIGKQMCFAILANRLC